MYQVYKEGIAKLIRESRTAKGYTQQELSDLAGLSLRSVQRIENAEVVPRAYTLRILFEKLEIRPSLPAPAHSAPEPSAGSVASATDPPTDPIPSPDTAGRPVISPQKINRPRKLILTFSTALLILLSIAAFVAQSPRFPETDFERFGLAIGAIAVYTVILYRIWK